MGFIGSPQNSYLEIEFPGLQTMTVFGDRVWKEGTKVKWSHKDRPPIQSDWCPYKKRRSGLRHVEGWSREDTGRGWHLHTQDRGLGRYQTCPCLHLGLLAPRLRNSKYPLFMCWVWGAWWQQPKLTHASDKWVLGSSGKVAPSQGGWEQLSIGGCTSWPREGSRSSLSLPSQRELQACTEH